jgi:membrane-associated HD superfamily phosphohydrolase
VDTALRTHTFPATRLVGAAPAWLLQAANVLGLIALVVFLYAVSPVGSSMRVGEVANSTVVAQRQVTYIDRAATAAKRRLAAASVAPRYRTDTSRAVERLGEARAFLAAAGPILASQQPPSKKLSAVKRLLPPTVTPTALQQFPLLTANDFKVVRDHSLTLLSQAIAWRFDSNQIPSTEFGLLASVPSSVTVPQRTAIGEILTTFLAPTLLPDA